jgi:hypothetical protein
MTVHVRRLVAPSYDIFDQLFAEAPRRRFPKRQQTEAPKQPTQPEAPTPEQLAADRAREGGRFLAAFGERGAVWFAQGKTFAEATELHTAELQAGAEAEQVARDEEAGQAAARQKSFVARLGSNYGKVAAGITLPRGA